CLGLGDLGEVADAEVVDGVLSEPDARIVGGGEVIHGQGAREQCHSEDCGGKYGKGCAESAGDRSRTPWRDWHSGRLSVPVLTCRTEARTCEGGERLTARIPCRRVQWLNCK